MKLVLSNRKFFKVTDATETEREQLRLILTKRIKNWRFHPKVKKGYWDGYITKLKRGELVPIGLWHYVKKNMAKYDYQVEIMGLEHLFDSNVPPFEEFVEWANSIMEPHTEIEKPYEYQVLSAYKFIKYRYGLGELATSSGKTLINWLVIRWLLENDDSINKILMIVPGIDLITQAADDFIDYNQKQFDINIQEIYSNAKDVTGEPNLVIGTYQSLTKKDKEFFKQFDGVIIDEGHKIKVMSIDKIMKKCGHTKLRIGVTGTLPKPGTLDFLSVMEHTGPIIAEISASELIDSGRATECEIKIFQLNYMDHSLREKLARLYKKGGDSKKRVYNLEKKYIIGSNKRLQFVTKTISEVEENSIVMFFRKKHGKCLRDRLREMNPNKHIFYIDGSVDKERRSEIIEKFKTSTDIILVASVNIFSTGISIKNLHYVFLCEPYKSEKIIRQTIGRLMRLHDSKDLATFVDFVDDFSCQYPDGVSKRTSYFNNYLLKHGKERVKIYQEQDFPFSIKSFNF